MGSKNDQMVIKQQILWLNFVKSFLFFSQIAGALAAVLMATTHVVFHLPAGVIGIVFYQILSDPVRLGAYVASFHTIYLLSMSVSIFGSLADFFIYLYVFAAFRKSAHTLFLMCIRCGAYSRKPRHQYNISLVHSNASTGRISTAENSRAINYADQKIREDKFYDEVAVW